MRSSRLAVGALLATAALAGANACGAAPSPSPTPTSSPTSSPTSAPSDPPPARPVVISDADPGRLLGPADAPDNNYGHRALPPAELAGMVALPCAGGPPTSDSQVLARNGMDMSFSFQPPGRGVDGEVSEALTLYRTGGAERYITELTAALAACPTDNTTTRATYRTVVARGFAGDASLLIGVTYAPASNPRLPSISSTYLAVIRAGDVVLVLRVSPFESGDASRPDTDRLVQAAIERAED